MSKKVCALFLILQMMIVLASCDSSTKSNTPPANAKYVSSQVIIPDIKPTAKPDAVYDNLKNVTLAWGFKKEKGKRPSMPANVDKLLAQYGGVYLSANPGKTIYLTFDEGYENGYTAPILDVLKKQSVPAAFFITGDYIKQQPELVKRMASEGHIVGNHTVNHPSMPSVTSNAKLAEEITRLDDDFFTLTNQHMRYIRPPKGEYSERTLAISKDLGYITVFWSFAYVDWNTDQQNGAQYAYERVMPYLHDGAVLLLHAVSKDNADALGQIITDARTQGFEFKSLNEL